MTRNCLVLLICLLGAACGDKLKEQPGRLGMPCKVTPDCGMTMDGKPLMCGDTAPNIGQCVFSCEAEGDCELRFGKHTFCIRAKQCVRECGKDSECPPYTGCNESGWCQYRRLN